MKKYEIEAPFGVPGTSRKEKPTLTGDGINTHTHMATLSGFTYKWFYYKNLIGQ